MSAITNSIKKNFTIGVIGAILFLTAFIVLDKVFNKNGSQYSSVEYTQRFIQKKQKQLSSFVQTSLPSVYNDEKIDKYYSAIKLDNLGRQNITILFYKDNELKYWTNNDIPISNVFDSCMFSQQVVQLRNGVYLCDVKYDSNVVVLGLALIKREYEIDNNYLKDYFVKGIDLPIETKILLKGTEHSIYSENGKYLFSLDLPENIHARENLVIVLFFIFIVFVFFALLLLHSLLGMLLKKRSMWVGFVFILCALIIRVLLYECKIPSVFSFSQLFAPLKYSSSFIMPSIGDAALNITFLLSICFCLVKTPAYSYYRSLRKFDFLIAILYAILCCFVTYLYLLFLESLVIGSNLYICLDNFFKYDFYSIMALCMVGLSTFLLFYIFKKLTSQICRFTRHPKICIISTAVGFAIGIIIWYFFFKFFLVGIIFAFVLFVLYLISVVRIVNIRSVSTILLLLFIFTGFAGFHILQLQSIKEREERKVIAEKLFIENDPVIEHFFQEFQKITRKDKVLQKMLVLQVDGDSIRNYLKKNHFVDFWDYYEVRSTSCLEFQKVRLLGSNIEISCTDYFIQKAERDAVKTATPGLFLMDDGFGNIVYCSDVLEFYNDQEGFTFYLFLQFSQRKFPIDKKYSKLILKKDILANTNLDGYSYAKYANESLIKSKGDYRYTTKLFCNVPSDEEFFILKRNGYTHLLYTRPKMNTTLIVSKKTPGFQETIKIFSSLFILFSFIVSMVLMVISVSLFFKGRKGNFKNRLQISVILLVMGASIVFGIVSVYYIGEIHTEKNADIFKQRINNVVAKLEEDYKEYSEIDISVKGTYEELTKKILRHFNAYRDDITVFDLSGKMITSTSPELYGTGIISSLMNPFAFKALDNNKSYLYSRIEKSMGYDYLNTYISIRNAGNRTLAYVSIPYFFNEDSKNELRDFVITYINIYALIILLLFCLLIFITNLITKPLLLIRKQVEKFTIGKKIDWKSNDEIGALVSEYNRMIDKLEESAYLFAKTERENGWREMTRQVAHEIKTPLTPMKLSVQQLQKTWNDQVPDFGKRLERTTQILIEQIDILSKIASTFLDFSKMPHTVFDKMDLLESINSIIDLYKEDTNLEISFLTNSLNECYILGDKQQLIRVFGNLFKNAEQAIPHGRKGELTITIEKWQKNFVLRFKDNGSGIPDSQKHLVFHPHFTTKEDGTGLGLSIVKNILESIGGTIEFKSVDDEGTVFTILLPAVEDENKDE